MIAYRRFIGPPIFFTGPPTLSSVVDLGLTSFAESVIAESMFKFIVNTVPIDCLAP